MAQLSAPDWIDLVDDPDALLRKVLVHFQQTLATSDTGRAFLERRGLNDPRLVQRFGLGYADGSLGRALPPATRVSGKRVRQALKGLGISRPTGHGHFDGSVVVPVTSVTGKVVDVYGRKTTPRLRAGTAYHTYLHDPPHRIFNLGGLDGATYAIVCGSIIDALSFSVAGFHNVIACYGPGGLADWSAIPDVASDRYSGQSLADELVGHLDLFNIQRAYIALRRSSLGQEVGDLVAGKLLAVGISAYRIGFPLRQDANDFLVGHPPAERSFGQVLRGAEWLGQGARDHLGQALFEPAPEPKPAPEVPAAPQGEAEDEAQDEDREIAAPTAVRSPRTGHVDSERPEPEDDPEPDRDEVIVERENRRYRVRGLAKNLSYSILKVNLMVTAGEAFHIDTLDLYVARQRTSFIKQAAGELHLPQETIKADVGKVILRLEEIQDERIEAALKGDKPEPFVLSEDDRREAMAMLEDPMLIERVQRDLGAGMIGEETNRLVAYIAATSRKLERPLAIVIQSSSSAGKSALMNRVLELMPPEDMVRFSAMTSQSLYYLGKDDLKHRILAIAEEEGAERASYPLKLLQSEGALSIATTGKEGTSGRIRTVEYHVEGPTMILMTTTATEMDEELLNRCIVLAVDEGVEQTRAIHQQQRHLQTLDGLLGDLDNDHVRHVHRNAQRLLRPLLVVNPLADRLTFVDDRTRTRRDHVKYLTLIRAIALLHQYQRPIKTVAHQGQLLEYIEVTPADISLANELAAEVLTRSLDSLAPQTRRLLAMLDEMMVARGDDEDPACFSRRDVMAFTGWTYRQVGIHLRRLVELEYLTLRRTDGHHRYELRPEARSRNDAHPLIGLIDVDALTAEVPDRPAMYHPEEAMYGVEPSDVPGCTPGVVRPQAQAQEEDSAGCTATADQASPLRGAPPANQTRHRAEEAPESG